MIDPISIALTVLAIYGMLKRSPQWAGEMAEEWQAARRGEESPAAQARRQRLIDAGVDPATGGPMRQYLGNRWRDYWLDADADATNRRADRLDKETAGEALSWRERMRSRMDDETTRRAEHWRTRPPADVVPPVAPVADGDPGPDSGTGGAKDPTPQAGGGPAPVGPDLTVDTDTDPAPDFDTADGARSGTVHGDDHTYTPPDPGPQHEGVFSGWMRDAPFATEPTNRDPIRVDATVGAPTRNNNAQSAAPAAITAGGTMPNAVAQQAVTGVVSGAAEARAIQAALNAATEEYVAKLARIRQRIGSLGEQTLGTVQMSGKSQVINYTAQAAEAAAAAAGNARSCTEEVVPLLGSVARAFDRINS